MWKAQRQVKEFHLKHSQYISAVPTIPPDVVKDLRIELIFEEAHEFRVGAEMKDIIRVADALGDLIYVILGAAVSYGIDMEPIFETIHKSNMSKESGFKSRSGKALKTSSFAPPELREILKKQGGGYNGR